MLDHKYHLRRIAEKSDFVFEEDRDIILYGAGSLGVLAIETLRNAGIEPKVMVDKIKTGDLLGVPILKLKDLAGSEKKEKLFLICISTVSYNVILKELRNMGIEHVMQFYTYAGLVCPKTLNNGWMLRDRDYDVKKAAYICNKLKHDEKSVAHYITFLYWKRFNREVVLDGHPIETGNKYFRCDIMPDLSEEETLLDLGCYKGNIIGKFMDTVRCKYKKVIGVEPVHKFLNVAKNRFLNYKNVLFYDYAISDCVATGYINEQVGMACHIDDRGGMAAKIRTIDSLDLKPTIIKIHTEGEELNCIKGGMETIRSSRPILMVLADHNEDGWYEIPSFVEKLEGYRLYFRLHDYCGNSAVWYFVPMGREITCVQ